MSNEDIEKAKIESIHLSSTVKMDILTTRNSFWDIKWLIFVFNNN